MTDERRKEVEEYDLYRIDYEIINKDCFAWKNENCIALKRIMCAETLCPFYKTAHQLRSELVQTELRLSMALHNNRH